MPGQCYSCGSQFGVFKKEHGCKNCGYSFCNKCLHAKSVPVPRRKNEKHHVCFQCHKILTGVVKPEDVQTQYELPQAYIKRMEALKEKESGNGSLSKNQSGQGQGQPIPAHLKNLAKPDRDIAMRLERLKESDKPKEKVTNADISARLANLQGQPYRPEQKPAYQPPDRRPQVQQINDLLNEIADEIEIDSQAPDPVRDIETRLDHLRQGPGNQSQRDSKQPDENNLNKAASGTNKDEMYRKNIVGEASASNHDVDMEEIHRLMAMTASELEMDAKKAMNDMEKDKELMDRLKELQRKKQDKEGNDGEESDKDGFSRNNGAEKYNFDSDEDDEEASRRIIQRYLEECKIDEKAMNSQDSSVTSDKMKKKREDRSGKGGEMAPPDIKPLSKKDVAGNDSDDYSDPDELPYCSICTEDAVIRCKDCDMDLYCKRCFKECHQEMEITDHRTMPYKAPKGYH